MTSPNRFTAPKATFARHARTAALRSARRLVAIAIVGAALGSGSRADAAFLYATTYGGAVVRIAPDGTTSVVTTTVTNPYGLAVSGAGNLYVNDHLSGVTRVFTPAGVLINTFTFVGAIPTAMTFGPDGNLYSTPTTA